MRELVEEFTNTGKYDWENTIDPFYDKKEQIIFGRSNFYCKNDRQNVKNTDILIIKGQEEDIGNLKIEIEYKFNEEGSQQIILNFLELNINDL